MDEDFFSDDATLDALPEDELQALEDAAVKGTQHPAQSQFQLQSQHQHQQAQYQFNSNNGRAPSCGPPQLPVGPPLQRQQARFQQRQNEGYQRQKLQALPTLPYTNKHQLPEIQQYTLAPVLPDNPASSDDYGGFDETTELWDAVAPKAEMHQYYGEEGGNGGGGQDINGYGDGQQPIGSLVYEDRVDLVGLGDMMVGVEAGGGYDQAVGGAYGNQGQVQQKQQDSINLKDLMARITELQNEKERLQEDLRCARAIVTSKNGEISVVRRNNAQSEAAHRAAIAQVEQKQNEERERFKLQLEAVEAESERMRTETVFLRKEVEEVVKQNRNLAKKPVRHQIMAVGGESTSFRTSAPIRHNTETHQSPATTPRRNKGYSFRDGFEDEEMVSPSKAKYRSPMKPGIKRKRSLMDSPKTTELQLSHSKKIPVEHTPIQVVDEMLLEKLWIEDGRFEFFKAVMAHRPAPGVERSFDGLSKFSFPSSPEVSISTLFQDKITSLQSTAAKSEFSTGVCRVLLSIWRRCLEESSYGALDLVLGLLQFSIIWDQGSTCHKFFEEAVDLVQQTVDINAIPMLKKNIALLEEGIDIGICLKLLEGIALGLVGDERRTKRFWKCIRSDFPLMMLNLNQHLSHIQRMASILSTSCLGDSFGPLVSNEADQRKNEGHLLEATTKVLAYPPRTIPGEPRYTKVEIIELRREVLQFLGGVSGMKLGLAALAGHPHVLTWLVKRMADELEDIYECKFGREQSIQLVNLAMRLLHGILIVHGQDCVSKIATPSTSHKYLVAMTRLAFSEGLSQEFGIDDNTRKSAQELLESTITPEEAESLEMLFSPSQ